METLDDKQIKDIIENILFITDKPISVAQMSSVTEIKDKNIILKILSELKDEYLNSNRAVQVIEVAGGYQLSTKPEYGRWVRKLYKDKLIAKLTSASLETLAIIAYKEPVTRADIEQIRGVDAIAPLETLIEKGLIEVTGKRDTAGKPLLYGVTDRFLKQFGLNSSEDLPSLDTFADDEKKPKQQELFDRPEEKIIVFDEDKPAESTVENIETKEPQAENEAKNITDENTSEDNLASEMPLSDAGGNEPIEKNDEDEEQLKEESGETVSGEPETTLNTQDTETISDESDNLE